MNQIFKKLLRVKILSRVPPTLEEDDPEKRLDFENAVVVVSPRLSKNGLLFGPEDWALLSVDSKSPPTRPVRVVFNELIESDEECYISPQLWFNLRLGPLEDLEKHFWKHPFELPDAEIEVSLVKPSRSNSDIIIYINMQKI